MTCIVAIGHPSIGTDLNPHDVFFVGNLTEAGIQPGSTCTVEGCYQYVYLGDGYTVLKILTPRDFCTIQGEISYIAIRHKTSIIV